MQAITNTTGISRMKNQKSRKRKMISVIRLLLAAWCFPALNLALPTTGSAQEAPFKLEMPLRCTQGSDCWIVNYVDVDTGPGVQDYMCGRASYDAHKGTDIAIMDANVMRQGVEIFASAGGIVRGTRNDMRDIDFNMGGGRESVKTKECGNGVLLDHGGGWTTQYCHMLRESVTVNKGDKVEAGQTLGLVGLSGLS